MQTFYVDVYFFINFSVDFLSLYFAAKMAKMPTSITRLLIGGVIGAIVAVINVFISNVILGYVSLFLGFLLMILVSLKKVTVKRKIKFAFCFSIVETLVGGIVYCLYDFLDKHLGQYIDSSFGGTQNRSLLMLSIIILISIGVFKSLVSVFSFVQGSDTIEVEIEMQGRVVCGEALIDTGNLAKDPTDLKDVMLIGSDLARELLGRDFLGVEELSGLDCDMKKRVKLIPVTFGKERRLLVGFRPDSVIVKTRRGKELVDIAVAIDKEGGRYGGTHILMPSAAVRDVIK